MAKGYTPKQPKICAKAYKSLLGAHQSLAVQGKLPVLTIACGLLLSLDWQSGARDGGHDRFSRRSGGGHGSGTQSRCSSGGGAYSIQLTSNKRETRTWNGSGGFFLRRKITRPTHNLKIRFYRPQKFFAFWFRCTMLFDISMSSITCLPPSIDALALRLRCFALTLCFRSSCSCWDNTFSWTSPVSSSQHRSSNLIHSRCILNF